MLEGRNRSPSHTLKLDAAIVLYRGIIICNSPIAEPCPVLNCAPEVLFMALRKVEFVAQELGVSEQRVYELVRKGYFPPGAVTRLE